LNGESGDNSWRRLLYVFCELRHEPRHRVSLEILVGRGQLDDIGLKALRSEFDFYPGLRFQVEVPRWILGSASGACKDQQFVAVATRNQRDRPQLSRPRCEWEKSRESPVSECGDRLGRPLDHRHADRRLFPIVAPEIVERHGRIEITAD
jgi:hypothetical protein